MSFIVWNLTCVLLSLEVLAAVPFSSEDFVSVADPDGVFAGIEIQKTELTYAQYEALNSTLPLENRNPWNGQDCRLPQHIARSYGPRFPAACISWDDAQAYLNQLNRQDTTYRYRLPTNEELQHLIALTLASIQGQREQINERVFKRYAWYQANSNLKAQRVCTRELVLGLCDVLGNLWEWTSSPFQNEDRYLIRGGSWSNLRRTIRHAIGFSEAASIGHSNVGLRLVRELKN